jgi:hypothetical protein
MKITRIESLHADAGWRNLDFLKISIDEGIAGWSECNESFGGGASPRSSRSSSRPWWAIGRPPAG